VTQLSQSLTTEELVGWAAFFELRNEEEEKAMDRAQMRSRASSLQSR
jgi:hypothetical protein